MDSSADNEPVLKRAKIQEESEMEQEGNVDVDESAARLIATDESAAVKWGSADADMKSTEEEEEDEEDYVEREHPESILNKVQYGPCFNEDNPEHYNDVMVLLTALEEEDKTNQYFQLCDFFDKMIEMGELKISSMDEYLDNEDEFLADTKKKFQSSVLQLKGEKVLLTDSNFGAICLERVGNMLRMKEAHRDKKIRDSILELDLMVPPDISFVREHILKNFPHVSEYSICSAVQFYKKMIFMKDLVFGSHVEELKRQHQDLSNDIFEEDKCLLTCYNWVDRNFFYKLLPEKKKGIDITFQYLKEAGLLEDLK